MTDKETIPGPWCEDVAHLKHYEDLPIQPIDVIRANFTPEMLRGFYIGNIIKYVSRYRNKDGLRDLRKAKTYIEWLIEVEEEGGEE